MKFKLLGKLKVHNPFNKIGSQVLIKNIEKGTIFTTKVVTREDTSAKPGSAYDSGRTYS